uniref:hypothetical protein n=1 Tax=Streptomyces turgidiscabies TaxID=85558 RepID=UPI0027D77EA4|nr:hypothetical protein [Streptomyces turgidiscabies]
MAADLGVVLAEADVHFGPVAAEQHLAALPGPQRHASGQRKREDGAGQRRGRAPGEAPVGGGQQTAARSGHDPLPRPSP